MDYYTIAAQKALLDKEFTGKTIDSVRLRDFSQLYLVFEDGKALKLACIPRYALPVCHGKTIHPPETTRRTGI